MKHHKHQILFGSHFTASILVWTKDITNGAIAYIIYSNEYVTVARKLGFTSDNTNNFLIKGFALFNLANAIGFFDFLIAVIYLTIRFAERSDFADNIGVVSDCL